MRYFSKFKKSKQFYVDIYGSAYLNFKLNNNFFKIYSFLWRANSSLLKKVSNTYRRINSSKLKSRHLREKKVPHWSSERRFGIYILLRIFMLFYCNIKFHQFRKYFKIACRRKGYFSDNFLFLLEMRLDTFIFRSFNCFSFGFLRQLILHRGVLVNNKVVTHFNFNLRKLDKITFSTKILTRRLYTKKYKLFKYICRFFKQRRFVKRPFMYLRPSYSVINYSFKFFSLTVYYSSILHFNSHVYYPFRLHPDELFEITFDKLK